MFNEEGILNKIITAAVIGLLGWLVITTQDLSVQVAVMSASMDNIQSNITAAQADRYTRSEATADKALVSQRIEQTEQRVRELAERVRRVENEGQ